MQLEFKDGKKETNMSDIRESFASEVNLQLLKTESEQIKQDDKLQKIFDLDILGQF